MKMYKNISDIIRDEMYNFVRQDEEPGLLVANPPTGSGKTFAIKGLIEKLLVEDDKKIFIITDRKVNLPINEVKAAYKAAGKEEDFDDEVLVLDSIVENVIKKIKDVTPSEDFLKDKDAKKAFQDLKDDVEKYEGTKNSEIREYCREKIVGTNMANRGSEACFRTYVRKYFNQYYLDKPIEEKLDAVNNDEDFKWIKELYPAVNTKKARILIMSDDKLLYKNSTIIEPTYFLLGDPVTSNAIFIIDEFEKFKKRIVNVLCENAAAFSTDVCNIVCKLYTVMSREKVAFRHKIKNKNGYLDVQNFVKQVYDKYNLECFFKTDKHQEKELNFIFSSGNNNAVKSVKDIRIVPESLVNKVYFEESKEYKSKKKDTDINVFSLVHDMRRAINKFAYCLPQWSKEYSEYENKKRKSRSENGEYKIQTDDQSYASILNVFDFNSSEEKLINNIVDVNLSKKLYPKGMGLETFFEQGFNYLMFKDNPTHNEQTYLEYVNVATSPERMLIELAKKSKVIGLSATALIDSAISNFDMEHLRGRLGRHMQEISDSAKRKIQRFYDDIADLYAEKGIAIETKRISDFDNSSGDEREEELEKYLSRDLTEKMINDERMEIGVFKNGKHSLEQLFKFTQVIYEFVTDSDVNSCLCFTQNSTDSKEYRDWIEAIIKDIEEKNNIEKKAKVKFLIGKNYDNGKKEATSAMENGEKIMMWTTFPSAGAGQNNQYTVPKGLNTHRLFEELPDDDSRVTQKDIDMIFIGDITNIIKPPNQCEEDKEKIENIFGYEYLYYKNEISKKEKKELIEKTFEKKDVENFYKYDNVRKAVTSTVVQAVGRITRTFNKNSKIKICITDKTCNRMDMKVFDDIVLTPELKVVKNMLGEYHDPKETERKELEYIEMTCSKKSLNSSGIILKSLSGAYNDNDDNDLRKYSRLRELCLKYPDADEADIINDDMARLADYKDLALIDNLGGGEYYCYIDEQEELDYVRVGFTKESLNKAIKEYEKKGNYIDAKNIRTVNMDNARLNDLFKYQGLKEYFIKNGYKTEFGKKEFILNPVVYNSIYKGALGEKAGYFIMKDAFGIELVPTEGEEFERFDFVDKAAGVYYDFKHWRGAIMKDKEGFGKAFEKMKEINAKKAVIINILPTDKDAVPIPKKQEDMLIWTIPRLIDEDGRVPKEIVKIISEL